MQPLDYADDVVEREDWSESLEAVFDEHAELRDVLVQMRETADLGVLTGQLERLHGLLESHFEREEQDQGMARMMAEASESHRRVAAELVVDHPAILSAVRDLVERVRADESLSIAAVEREVGDILERLSIHDGLENDLIRDITSMDPAAATYARQTRSKALEANLRRTAVNVVIPEEQKVLLDVTSDFAGVYENTKKLLWEINHRYVGWSQTLEDLHRRAMGDFGHHVGHKRAAEAVGVLCDFYAKIASEATPAVARETAVRKFQYYLEKVARDAGDRLPLLLPALDCALDRLAEIFRHAPALASVASPRLKRLTDALLEAPVACGDTVERCIAVLAVALRESYRQRLAHADPADWWREQTRADTNAPLPEELIAVSHAHLRSCLDRLDSLEGSADSLEKRCANLLALPDNAQIDRATIGAASCVESEANEPWRNRLARIDWLIRVLSLETLAAMHEQALSEISHLYTDALQDADRDRLEHVVRNTFSSLRRSSLASSQTSLNLISKVGLEVLASGDPECFEVVVDEILEWEFPSADFSGFTDEWQVQVNPAHLRAIRTYLSLIEGNPEIARALIAALVVHLKIGGVFIADTDLFQKDISRLLNSDIGPVYHQIKHLLKIFPAYFNDIGAEGELRDVSSHLDEIRGRKDPLCHFLRKQCHVESNPLLIGFTHEIARFWATGDREPLRPFVPAALFEGLDLHDEEYAGLREVFTALVESDDLDSLFERDPAEVEARLRNMGEGRTVDRDKAALLFKLRRLIGRKYEIDHDDLLDRLAAESAVSPEQLEGLRAALECDDCETALKILLDVLEHLKSVATSTEKTEGYEDVYRKRHIAVGIPSMYGRYREEKFEAIGLTFRIESLANTLFERLFAEEHFEFITRKTLFKVARWLGMARRALKVDGFRGHGLATGTAMLDQALRAEGFRVDQYINILQILSRSVEQLIRIRFLDVYEDLLDRIVTHRIENSATPTEAGSDQQEQVLKISEAFFRDLIAQSFALQPLDHLLGRVLRVIVQWRERFDRHTLTLLMTYDAERSFVEISPETGPHDGAIYLGNKGHAIKRMAHDGIPVPDGFIVTTEIFRCREAMSLCEELEQEVKAQLRLQVKRLEGISGARFGDPARPLLLSVRSGSAISMPGILDTFLNVGMTAEIAEGFARTTGRPWAAWDAYRRFVQGWGMGHGIKRDSFNLLMREAKQAAGVPKKADMTSEQMKGLALVYRDFVEESVGTISEDPYQQLSTCMDLVLASWHSKTAQSYRSATRIADEWGTAVVVQTMVYGNLSRRSGTGVVLTCDPRPTRGDVRLRGEIRLHGDFIVQGQGDDVVSGLVETFPISERQRLSEAEPAPISLEKDFPKVYAGLNEHGRSMVQEQGMFHQEIEFTFERDDAGGLYILQTRDAVVSQATTVPAFVPSEELELAKVATGIGVAGGALSGRVALNADDITALRERYPDTPVVLLRPDTVPDDIPLILHTDGMVTAIGGATSHAALVAQRLGRTCVVGCRQLEIYEDQRCSKIAGKQIATGDYLSINGTDGSIYLGKHPATTVRRQRLT